MAEKLENTGQSQSANQQANPKKWWQWFLVYPIVITSVIAAIPTYVELYHSQKLGVAYGSSNKAVEQKDLWQKNMDCTQAPYDWLVTPSNVKVDATICQSGDVLVRIHLPTDEKRYEWVAIERHFGARTESGFVKTAKADMSNRQIIIAQQSMVICQRWIDNTRLLRRISVAGRGCFDEIVNTHTGYVESSRPAPCDSNC